MSKKAKRALVAAGLTSEIDAILSGDVVITDAAELAQDTAETTLADGAGETAADDSTDDATTLALAMAATDPAGIDLTDAAAELHGEDAGQDDSRPADVLADRPYMLIITGQYDSLVAACMSAEQLAKLARVGICVAYADTGETVRCFDAPRGRGKRSDSTDDGVHAPRGSDWQSKSGEAVRAMLRPDGATMDEMRIFTGWTFGKKYIAQLARSFHVEVTDHPATARTKRHWTAAPADGFLAPDDYDMPEASQEAGAADPGNVVQLSDRLAAD